MRQLATGTMLAAMMLWVGCAQIQPGQDSLVVRAEQTAEVASATLTAFVTWAYNNQATVGENVQKAANAIRLTAPKSIDSLRATTKVYKLNRTPENKATLETWLKVVEQLEREALKWYAPSTPPQ